MIVNDSLINIAFHLKYLGVTIDSKIRFHILHMCSILLFQHIPVLVGCCCLPLTLASGGSPILLLAVHQPATQSTNPGVTMWCVCGCS